MVPGAKLPNERDLAQQLKTSRTAVRSALAMMERQGLIRRRVGSGTFLTDDADRVFEPHGPDRASARTRACRASSRSSRAACSSSRR